MNQENSSASSVPLDEEDIADVDHQNEPPSDSDSSQDSENEDDKLEEKIRSLRFKLADNPYDYQTYIDLINLLRSTGELDLLREAREDFAKKFPLTPTLWLEWINDEKTCDESNREAIVQLFERAVLDYASVDLWLEYCQFVMGGFATHGPESVRKILEAGLMQVGLDCCKGSLLWDLYVVFEKQVIATLTSEVDQVEQKKRIFNLYKRQLSVPLLEIESTYDEFTQWLSREESLSFVSQEDLNQVKKSYENALKQVKKVKPFEEEILITPSKIAEYAVYAETNCTPAFTQCLYERGITSDPLNGELWTKYLLFLERKVKIEEISVKTFSRAVRNCPWYGNIWCEYIRCQERHQQTLEQIVPTLERALSSGVTGYHMKEIWMTYLDCMRRKTNFNDEKSVKILRDTFNSAADHLAGIPDADPTFSVLQYAARVEAVFCKDITAAREIWRNMLQVKELTSKAHMWLEYFNLEYTYGNKGEAKKVLYQAIQATRDWPESVGTLLVKLEKEEGDSLEGFERAVDKYQRVMKKIETRTQGKEEKSDLSATSTQGKQDRKRKAPAAAAATDASTTHENKSHGKPDTKRPRKEFQFSTGQENNKLFVSKLSKEVNSQLLRDVFGKFDGLKDIRMVIGKNGHSKGCAYVEFSDEQSALTAMNATNGSKVGSKNISVAISDPTKRSKPASVTTNNDVRPTSSQTLGSGSISATGDSKRGITG